MEPALWNMRTIRNYISEPGRTGAAEAAMMKADAMRMALLNMVCVDEVAIGGRTGFQRVEYLSSYTGGNTRGMSRLSKIPVNVVEVG